MTDAEAEAIEVLVDLLDSVDEVQREVRVRLETIALEIHEALDKMMAAVGPKNG